MANKKNTTIKVGEKEYNYYRMTKTIGHEIVDGVSKPIKKQFTGQSRKEAEAKYQKWLTERYAEPIIDSGKMFGELADFYAENILSINSKYSIGTRDLYIRAYNSHLRNSSMRNIMMTNLTSADVQRVYNSLDISKAALANVNKFLKGFLEWGYHNGYCGFILSGVVVPEKVEVHHQDDIITWTDDELNIIQTAEPDYVLLPFIKFAIYTGMRISEILGLNWSDIKSDRITVRRQYYRGDWCNPKGDKERDIPLHPVLRDLIETMDHSSNIIFTTANGTPYDYKNINRSIDRFYKRIGVEHKKFHAYRATFCTNLCKKGVPIQIASQLMGHENIMVTAKYYASVSMDEMNDAIAKL